MHPAIAIITAEGIPRRENETAVSCRQFVPGRVSSLMPVVVSFSRQEGRIVRINLVSPRESPSILRFTFEKLSVRRWRFDAVFRSNDDLKNLNDEQRVDRRGNWVSTGDEISRRGLMDELGSDLRRVPCWLAGIKIDGRDTFINRAQLARHSSCVRTSTLVNVTQDDDDIPRANHPDQRLMHCLIFIAFRINFGGGNFNTFEGG